MIIVHREEKKNEADETLFISVFYVVVSGFSEIAITNLKITQKRDQFVSSGEVEDYKKDETKTARAQKYPKYVKGI